MPEDKEKRLNVRVDPRLHKALRVKAAEDDVTLQELVEAYLWKLAGLKPPDEGAKGGALYPLPRSNALSFADRPR